MDKRSLLMGTGLSPIIFAQQEKDRAQMMRHYTASAIINGGRYEITFAAPASAAKVKFPITDLLTLAGVDPKADVRIQSQTLRAVDPSVPLTFPEKV